MKGIMRFGRKGKITPRFIGPYQILKRVGNAAYRLDLPPELESVHPVFHISMLRKCLSDLALVVPTDSISVT